MDKKEKMKTNSNPFSCCKDCFVLVDIYNSPDQLYHSNNKDCECHTNTKEV